MKVNPLVHDHRPALPAGAHFIALFTSGHAHLLGRVSHGVRQLSQAGAMATTYWRSLPERFSGVQLDAFLCLPDHIAFVIILHDTQAVGHLESGRRHGALGEVMQWYQAETNRQFRQWIHSRLPAGADRRLWQQRYHERPILDQAQLTAVRRYISRQPARWVNQSEIRSTLTIIGRSL